MTRPQQRLARHDVHIKLRDKAAGMPFVGSLTLFNAQGKVVNFSRQWPVPVIDANDRDFFKALRDDPNLNAYLGQPVRNRASGTWVMHLARKVSGPKGEFLGLISGAVELSYFEDFFGDIALAPGSTIEVFRNDATLLVRHPKVETVIGQKFPAAEAIRLVAAAEQGVGRDTSASEERIVAAHRVDGYPIVVSVNKTTAAVLADWRSTATYLAGIAGLTILAIAGIAFLFIRLFGNYHALMHSRAEQEKAEQLREQSRRFDVALSHMSQGLCMFDADKRLIVCNRALRRAVRVDRGADPARHHAAHDPGAPGRRRECARGCQDLLQRPAQSGRDQQVLSGHPQAARRTLRLDRASADGRRRLGGDARGRHPYAARRSRARPGDRRGRAVPCARTRRGGRQQGEVELPRRHEPRDPHADERRDRPVRGAARSPA